MGTIFVPYPYPNRGISHGLTGIGSPLTSLIQISVGQNFYHRLAASAGMLVNKAHMYFLFLSWTLAQDAFMAKCVPPYLRLVVRINKLILVKKMW
jgi:hypothetical protein